MKTPQKVLFCSELWHFAATSHPRLSALTPPHSAGVPGRAGAPAAVPGPHLAACRGQRGHPTFDSPVTVVVTVRMEGKGGEGSLMRDEEGVFQGSQWSVLSGSSDQRGFIRGQLIIAVTFNTVLLWWSARSGPVRTPGAAVWDAAGFLCA